MSEEIRYYKSVENASSVISDLLILSKILFISELMEVNKIPADQLIKYIQRIEPGSKLIMIAINNESLKAYIMIACSKIIAAYLRDTGTMTIGKEVLRKLSSKGQNLMVYTYSIPTDKLPEELKPFVYEAFKECGMTEEIKDFVGTSPYGYEITDFMGQVASIHTALYSRDEKITIIVPNPTFWNTELLKNIKESLLMDYIVLKALSNDKTQLNKYVAMTAKAVGLAIPRNTYRMLREFMTSPPALIIEGQISESIGDKVAELTNRNELMKVCLKSLLNYLRKAHSIGIHHLWLSTDKVLLNVTENDMKVLILGFLGSKKNFNGIQKLANPAFIDPLFLLGISSPKKADIYSFGMIAFFLYSNGSTIKWREILTGYLLRKYPRKEVLKNLKTENLSKIIKHLGDNTTDLVNVLKETDAYEKADLRYLKLVKDRKLREIIKKCIVLNDEQRFKNFDEVMDEFEIKDQ